MLRGDFYMAEPWLNPLQPESTFAYIMCCWELLLIFIDQRLCLKGIVEGKTRNTRHYLMSCLVLMIITASLLMKVSIAKQDTERLQSP